MNAHIWSYREPLSEHIKSHIELLTEYLTKRERNQLIAEIENHLGSCIQEKKIQLNIKNSEEKKRKLSSILDNSQQFLVDMNNIISEEYADAAKVHLLENDEDKWLKLKVLELDLPNHLDSLVEIINYLEMLNSLKDVVYKETKDKRTPQHIFYCELKRIFNDYDLNKEENTIDQLYKLIMKQIGIIIKEDKELVYDCTSLEKE
ncbi:MAG: hypothetical protein OQL19_01040 [Gammaproteobacteria bacterium]|nr:hypothetical protein [Gammaproteobacteria bacterium]